MPPNLTAPQPPQFKNGSLRDFFILHYNVLRLTGIANDFSAAALLLDHALKHEHGRLQMHLVNIAGRDGGLSLYHYSIALRAVQTICGRENALGDQMIEMKEAARAFRKRFADAERVRTSIAHVAEFMQSERAYKDNRQKVSENYFKYGPGVIDARTRVYTAHFKSRGATESRPCSYELTFDAVEFLVSNVSAVHKALAPLLL